MNRVVLCGRLAGRPRIAYTPCGVPVATFRLLVPRTGFRERRDETPDEVDCVAFRQTAMNLYTCGERDGRLNLEGRLRCEEYRNEEGRTVRGLRVHVDHGYFAEAGPEDVAVPLQVVPGGRQPAALPERTA